MRLVTRIARLMATVVLATGCSVTPLFGVEDLKGVFYYLYGDITVPPAGCAGPCMYGQAIDNLDTTVKPQVRLCWSNNIVLDVTITDPVFSNNCSALITADQPLTSTGTACGATCKGFSYPIPSGAVGAISPQDGNTHYLYALVISPQGITNKVVHGSPWAYTKKVLGNSVAGPLWPPNLETVASRMLPAQIAVVVNTGNIYSAGTAAGTVVCPGVAGATFWDNGAAGYFVTKHGIPCDTSHIVKVNISFGTNIAANNAGLLTAVGLTNALPATIQALALAWTRPSVVTGVTGTGDRSISSFFSRGSFVEGDGCLNGVPGLGQGPFNRYFNTSSKAPYTDFGTRLVMLLASGNCTNVACVDIIDDTVATNPSSATVWTEDSPTFRALVDSALASKDTNPVNGVVDIAYTADGRSQVDYSYSLSSQGTPSPINPSRIASSYQRGNVSSPVLRNIPLTTVNCLLCAIPAPNMAFVGGQTQTPFLAGAGLAVMPTSTGGNTPGDGSQTTILQSLAHGAVAAYASATEPCEQLTAKNPDFHVLLANYTQGQTAIESLWKSVRLTDQANFFGDPLASPFTILNSGALGGSVSYGRLVRFGRGKQY